MFMYLARNACFCWVHSLNPIHPVHKSHLLLDSITPFFFADRLLMVHDIPVEQCCIIHPACMIYNLWSWIDKGHSSSKRITSMKEKPKDTANLPWDHSIPDYQILCHMLEHSRLPHPCHMLEHSRLPLPSTSSFLITLGLYVFQFSPPLFSLDLLAKQLDL
jgi:hypothetical protein